LIRNVGGHPFAPYIIHGCYNLNCVS